MLSILILTQNNWMLFTLTFLDHTFKKVQLSLYSNIPISLCSKKLIHMLSIEMSGDTQRNPQRRCEVEALGATRHEGDRSHRSPVHGTDMRGTGLTDPLYTGQTWGGQVSQIPCTRDRHEGDRSHGSPVHRTAYLCESEQTLQYVQHYVPGHELQLLAVFLDQSLYIQHHLLSHYEAVCV